MEWAILERDDTGESNPEIAHHVRKIRDELITYAGRLDTVELYWRRGVAGWQPTGNGICLDKSKGNGKTPDPLQGAKLLVRWAYEIFEADGCKHFKVIGYGETSKGASKEILEKAFAWGAPDDEKEAKGAKDSEVVEVIRVLKETVGDFHKQKRDDHQDLRELAKYTIDMAKAVATNTQHTGDLVVQMMKLEREENDAAREHDFEKERSGRLFNMFDRFADEAAPGFGTWFQRWLDKLDPDGVIFGDLGDMADGTLAARLGKIWAGLNDEQCAKIKAELGENAWDLLNAAKKAKTDDEFRNIVHGIGPKIGPDPNAVKAKLAKLMPVIGEQRCKALVKLLIDAGA